MLKSSKSPRHFRFKMNTVAVYKRSEKREQVMVGHSGDGERNVLQGWLTGSHSEINVNGE